MQACPTGPNGKICSGFGLCTQSTGKCICSYDFQKIDCSEPLSYSVSSEFIVWRVWMAIWIGLIYIYCWLYLSYQIKKDTWNFRELKNVLIVLIISGLTFSLLWVCIDPEGFNGIVPLWLNEIFYVLFVAFAFTAWALVLSYWGSVVAYYEKPEGERGKMQPSYKKVTLIFVYYAFLILRILSFAFFFQEEIILKISGVFSAIILSFFGYFGVVYGIKLFRYSKSAQMHDENKRALIKKIRNASIISAIGCFISIIFGLIMNFVGTPVFCLQPTGFLLYYFVLYTMYLIGCITIVYSVSSLSVKRLCIRENWLKNVVN